MRKTRWLAFLLIAVLLLGGCASNTEEDWGNNSTGLGNVVIPSGENAEQAPENPSEQTPEQSPENPSGQTPEQSPEQTPEQTPGQGGGQNPQQPSSPSPEQPSQNPNEGVSNSEGVDLSKDVRFFGRTYEQNGTYYFNWTESGFEFTFNGTGAEATFETGTFSEANTPYIYILVDGKRVQQPVAITDSMQTVTLCEGLKKGNHTVRVVKRTNARSTPLGVMDITLLKNGVIQSPPAAKERRIEFIGDSITVGYGTLGDASTSSWSTLTEDGSCTYAALTGQALKAEYNVVAISGRGLAHNTGGDTDKLMPSLYPMLDEYNHPGVKWDFTKFKPHVVVVNLATNDHATSSDAEVTTAATAFLKDIRKHNPDAHIIVAYGLMGKQKEAALKNAVSAVKDSKTTFLALPQATAKVLGHPDKASHQAASKVLQAEIKKITGWK